MTHPTGSRRFRPTWTAVKTNLRQLDTDGLVGLLHDLYRASPDNQRFLHGRLLGSATELEKYRELIADAVFPNPFGRKLVRIAEAQRLVRHYEQATGDVVGTVDLLLTFVAAGTDQAADLGYGDEAYFAALGRALESAVKLIRQLGTDDIKNAKDRLQLIRNRAAKIGWGFSDVVDECVDAVLRSHDARPRKSRQ